MPSFMKHVLGCVLATMVPLLVNLSNPLAAAADLPINATRDEFLEFQFRMQVGAAPLGSNQFEVSPELFLSAGPACISENPGLFDPQTRSNNTATRVALERLKRKLEFVEVREPNDDSYFLGNPADIQFHVCTLMIAMGISNPIDALSTMVPTSFIIRALAMPDIDEVALGGLYRMFSDLTELTPVMIEDFFSSFFKRNHISWVMAESVIMSTFASASPAHALLKKTFLQYFYGSAIFQRYKIYFSKLILQEMSPDRFSKELRAEILQFSVGKLNDRVLSDTVFNSFTMWEFSLEQVVTIYKQFGPLLSPAEKLDAIQRVTASFTSVTSELKQEILSLMRSPALNIEQKNVLLLTVLSAPNKYSKFGLQFIVTLLTEELRKSTWDESIFSNMVSLVRDNELPEVQKRMLLNGLPQDLTMTKEKVADLLAAVEFFLLTSLVPGADVKTAVDRIIQLAPKDNRTKSFLKRIVSHGSYSSLTDTITWELIRHYDLDENEITSLIRAYFENGSPASPQIIDALIRKNELTASVVRYMAAMPNDLAKKEQFKSILEFVMNHPITDEQTKGQIRFKVTGEIPTLTDLPTIDWN